MYKKSNRKIQFAIPLEIYNFFSKRGEGDLIYKSANQQVKKICIDYYYKKTKKE